VKLARKLGMCAISVAALGLSTAGVAAAAPVTVPFQMNPSPYGNPNGSFDAPAARCAAVVGAQPGAVVITGGNPGGWGCPLSSQVQWMNLSTGATGTTQLSDGLNGIPAAATVNTGIGQVVVVVNPVAGIVTPGFATFHVP
jgi:hypothetical protein